MKKAKLIMKQPGMNDYNELAKIVNEIIDKLENKKEVVPIQLTMSVKDYGFFKGEKVPLPYKAHYTITNEEDYLHLIEKYNINSKDLIAFKDIIDKGRILSLSITVYEDLDEKDLKQEIAFNTVETINVNELGDLGNLLNNMGVSEVSVIKQGEKQKKKTKNKSGWGKIKKK